MLVEQLGVSQVAISMRLLAWGRFKRSENGCRMNWTIGRWSDAKTHAKFLPDKKESRSCIGLWQAMKSGSIFRILNARNLGLILPNHQHLSQDQIASDGRWWCAFGGRMSSTTSCDLVKLLMLTATTNNWSNCTVLCVKKALSEKTSWFSSTTTHHRNNGPKLFGDTQLGSATPSRLLTRPSTFWLSPVFIDGSRARWAAWFDSYEGVRKWLDKWFVSKDEKFFWRGIHKLPERWEKCIISEGKYFE